MGGISPRPRGQKQSPRCVIFASSLQQTAGRPGWMPPAPAGPAGQRCSVTKPRPWPGGSTPPTGSSVGGGPGSQGVSPSSFWPTREPVSGGRWPPTLQGARVRGRGFPPQPQWGRVPPRSRTPPYHGREYSGDLGNPSMAPANLPSTPRLHLLPWSNSPGVLGLGRSLSGQAEIQASLDQLPRCPRTRPKPLRPS